MTKLPTLCRVGGFIALALGGLLTACESEDVQPQKNQKEQVKAHDGPPTGGNGGGGGCTGCP